MKEPDNHKKEQKNKAADGNRTRDLRLTKATLYRLSHSSIYIFEGNLPLTVDNNSRKTIYCQQVILNFIPYNGGMCSKYENYFFAVARFRGTGYTVTEVKNEKEDLYEKNHTCICITEAT